jgi:hypothetical protein
LLGWIAGDVIATDPAVHPKLQALFAGPVGVKLDALLALASAWRRTSPMAAWRRSSCAPCSASSSCWSRDRSGASASCRTLSIRDAASPATPETAI